MAKIFRRINAKNFGGIEMLICYFDGACEPRNPGGNMGIGAVVTVNDEEVLFEHSVYVPAKPSNSNNVAEYSGFIAILKWLKENGKQESYIHIKGDSKLVIEQMKGNWRMKAGRYMAYAHEAKSLLKEFKNITLQWIPREQNGIADELSKKPMKENNCEFRIQPND
jgi:ribonuclease HI